MPSKIIKNGKLIMENRIFLNKNKSDDVDCVPCIDKFLLEGVKNAPAVLVFPGGAYRHRAEHEGEVVAKEFNSKGFHSFVVHYSVYPKQYPAPFLDAIAAMMHVKNHAEQYGIKKNAIAVCGFSAGGHLAASLGIFSGDIKAGISPKMMSDACPNAMILCYPVISFAEYTNEGSVQNLLGENPSPDLRQKFSWQKQVHSKTPPTFLWHTSDDAAVPVENSLMLADSLKKHSIPFELHVFPKGTHGLGLAKKFLRISQWANLASDWLKEISH
jgi:acetyl esterase/lipase